MKCKNCGNDISNGVKFCTNCGTRVEELESVENSFNSNVNTNNSGAEIGWGFLGFFLPIVGLILFLVWKDSKPSSSKASGIGALVGFCVSFVICIIMILLVIPIINNTNRAGSEIIDGLENVVKDKDVREAIDDFSKDVEDAIESEDGKKIIEDGKRIVESGRNAIEKGKNGDNSNYSDEFEDEMLEDMEEFEDSFFDDIPED